MTNVSKEFIMGQSKWLLTKGGFFFDNSHTPSLIFNGGAPQLINTRCHSMAFHYQHLLSKYGKWDELKCSITSICSKIFLVITVHIWNYSIAFISLKENKTKWKSSDCCITSIFLEKLNKI
jgi:hypothetical protein